MAHGYTPIPDPERAKAPSTEEYRQPPFAPFSMAEIVHPPGEIPMPVVDQLVISQAVYQTFRFQCDLGAGGFSGQARPTDFILISPGVQTYCVVRDQCRIRFAHIPARVARACLQRTPSDPLDFGPLHRQCNRDPLVAHSLEALWQEMAKGDRTTQLFLETMVSALLARLERLSQVQTRDNTEREKLAPFVSSAVIEYMQNNLAQPMSLEQLASRAGLSPFHFARAFRNTHGMPPHKYLIHLRMQRARELLERTDFPITDIAARTGYSSQHLVRHFRRYAGTSPGRYRRTMRRKS